jgi:DNA-directed RNA polymerase subunit K/omega
MPSTPDEVLSNFRRILIAAKRAEQLIGGARPRATSRHVKPTTVALEELHTGLVPWRLVTPEEFEVLRQEELAARERDDQTPAILAAPRPPVAVVEEPGLEEEELEELEDELEGPDFEGEELADVDVDEAVAEELLPTEE